MEKVLLKKTTAYMTLFMVVYTLFFAIVPIVRAAAIVRPPNNLGLVGYWSFDEGTGTQVGDFSGNGNSGVLNNGPVWTGGKSRGALAFDGVNDYVIMNDVVTTNPTSFTIAGWFRKDGNGHTYECVLHQGSTNTIGSSSFWMGIDLDDNLTATIGATTGVGWAAGQTTIKAFAGEWNHMVASWDGSVVRVYVNGEYIKQYNLSSYTNLSTPVRFGSSANGTNYQFNGTIDEVRIYNRGLSAAEVELLYSNTKSTIVGITPVDRYSDGLVGHWTFDGKHTTATTAEDVAGSNNGTISGAIPTRGVIGQAMSFDGINNNVSVADNSAFNSFGTSPFSVSAWIKTTSTSFTSIVDNKTAGTNNPGYNLQITASDGKAYFRVATGTGQVHTGYSLTTVADGEWHHLVGTRDGSGLKLYVNGTLENQNSGCGSCNVSGSQNLLFGSYGSGGFLDGSIDDIRIYDRALSAEEVESLYLSYNPAIKIHKPQVVATGGVETVIEQDGKYYRVHTFAEVGESSLNVLSGGEVDYLVVGGGGGGGGMGGGGGAGGLRKYVFGEADNTSQAFKYLRISNYPIIVGGGGEGTDTLDNGFNGGNSSFAGITAIGGGGGASGVGTAGSSGGSGGGGGIAASPGATSVAGGQGSQGFGGGTTTSTANTTGGSGGGGAGQAGEGIVDATRGGNGGDGIQSSITSVPVYYAGGGGGGTHISTLGGSGGLGGGGNGASRNNDIASVSGIDGLGGGGGGGSTPGPSVRPGSAGGSGVVIVRYEITQADYEAEI